MPNPQDTITVELSRKKVEQYLRAPYGGASFPIHDALRTALAEGQGEKGKLSPKLGLLGSDGFVLTAGRLRFSYSDSDECTCCEGAHCYGCGIDLDGHPLGAAGLSKMVTDFVYPLRHQGMEGRPVEVAIVLKQPSPDSKEETRG